MAMGMRCCLAALLLVGGAAGATLDKDCVVTSVMVDGREVTRSCYDEGITKPPFVSNAPAYGRFESCTG